MIQANELRIGNLIETILNKDFVIVNSITVQEVKDGYLYLINSLLPEHLTPIPLTPDILEKCGFETDGFYYSLDDFIIKNDFSELRFPGEYNSEGERVFVDCRYLHQLQNLYFALTGEELQINL